MSKALYEPSTMRQLAAAGYDTRQLQRRPAPLSSESGTPPWPTTYNINVVSAWCVTRYALGWDRIDENPNANYPPHRSVFNNYRLRLGSTNSTRTAADGDYWVFGARLGPQNSLWYLAGTFLLGPDFGNINVDYYGPVTENVDGTLTPDVDTVESNGDWIWAQMQPVSWLIGYNASEKTDMACDPLFSILGDPGVLSTTYMGPTDWTTDGGPGIYYFKMRVDSKSASSSGYKAAVADLWLVRGDTLSASSVGVYLG